MKIRNLVICIIATFGLANLVVYTLTKAAKELDSLKNGFNRKFKDNQVSLLNSRSFPITVNRPCGYDNEHIYFSSNDPRRIYFTDYELSNFDSLLVPFPINRSILSNYQIIVNSPFVSLYAGNYATFFSTSFGDTSTKATTVEPPLFTQVTELSSRNPIVKGFDSSRKIQLIQKLDFSSGKIMSRRNIFGPQTDGGFSTDGLISYDSTSQNIIFMQYYVNRFFCLDTNLNLKYTGKTIDTISNNPVSTKTFAKNNSTGSLMPATPLKRINTALGISMNKIYIASKLKGDNEKNSDFSNNIALDIYRLIDGSYMESIYIPNYKGKQLKKFYIIDDKFFAFYWDYLTNCVSFKNQSS